MSASIRARGRPGFIHITRIVLIPRKAAYRALVRPAVVTHSLGSATMFKRPTLLALVVMAGCLPATEKDFQMAQTIQEMADAVNEIRLQSYELQDRVDSLTMAVAKRDTVIRQLANLAGVQIPP
jgi:hypothetical protein